MPQLTKDRRERYQKPKDGVQDASGVLPHHSDPLLGSLLVTEGGAHAAVHVHNDSLRRSAVMHTIDPPQLLQIIPYWSLS